jgi:hypothetical protein
LRHWLCTTALGGERTGIFVLGGVLAWLFVLKSGVHATLAGVALGLLIPLRRRDGSSPLHELEHGLHPYVKFAILPLFAFANAGLPLDGFSLDNLSQQVPLGIIAGLGVGKPVGVMLAVLLLVATGLAKLPQGVNWRYMVGVSCLAGIGFTMSLFIGSLAFADPANRRPGAGGCGGRIAALDPPRLRHHVARESAVRLCCPVMTACLRAFISTASRGGQWETAGSQRIALPRNAKQQDGRGPCQFHLAAP